MTRGESSIDAVAAAARDESLDFAGMSSPDGALTLLIAEAAGDALGDAAALARVVEGHGGQVVKTEGGAAMCSFGSAHAGLRAAIDLQRALGASELRIGLHSGFVMADASEFFGRNVVLAARIADHAQPGEVLVSAALREYTESDPTLRFEDRGRQHFKGLLGEHAVYSVELAG